MNTARIVVLTIAVGAGGVAAYLARGSDNTSPPPEPVVQLQTVDVLVAKSDIGLGQSVVPDDLVWQTWPAASASNSFIRRSERPDATKEVTGSIARAPFIAGEPIREPKLVKANGSGFMAAILPTGMRAISTEISPETGAGGFILPNDRVDVIVTLQVSETPKAFAARTLLRDVRVLAVDQTFAQDKDQKTVIAKTATLELSPQQSEVVSAASSTGVVSLALRALGDNANTDVAMNSNKYNNGVVSVIRYGVVRGRAPATGE